MFGDARGVRPVVLAVIAAVVGVAGWLVDRLLAAYGAGLPQVSWLSSVVLLFTAAVILVAGVQVKRLKEGRPGPNPVSPLRAARTVVLAQAAALTGAAVVGWYVAMFLTLLPNSDIPSVRGGLWPTAGTILAGLVLAGVGLLVQRWCRIDDSDQPPTGAGGDARMTPA